MSFRENIAALSERDFRLFYIGHTASLLGDAMMLVATPFIVFQLGGDATDVGLVLAAQTAALVATLLIGGVLADRFSRRRLMLGADALRATVQTIYAVLLLTGEAEIWMVVVAQVMGGLCMGVFEPATSGLIPETVSERRLQGANALRGIAWSVADTVGPAIAGGIIALVGTGEVVVVDALTFGASVVTLGAMRLRPTPAGASGEGFIAEMRAGWDEFRSRRWLWTVVAAFALINAFVYGPFIVLGASISEDAFGGAGAWATILAVGGVGAIIGGFTGLHITPRKPLVVGMWVCLAWAPSLVLLGAEAPVIAIALALAVGEVGFSIFGTLWDTALQREIPPEMLSRVSSYDWFGSSVMHPVGYALAGPLAILLGTAGALYAGAALLVVAVLATVAFGRLGSVGGGPPAEAIGEPMVDAYSTGRAASINFDAARKSSRP